MTIDRKAINIDFDVLAKAEVYNNATNADSLTNEDTFIPSDDVLLAQGPSLACALPVTKTDNALSSDGYNMVYGYVKLVAQNFTNLMLTSPGEKTMDPKFGVGLHRFLFDASISVSPSRVKGRITNQSARYMPFIAIQNIDISEDKSIESFNLDSPVRVAVEYRITPLNVTQAFSYPNLDRTGETSFFRGNS